MHDNWLETNFASLYLEQLLKESILACGRTAPNPTVAALAFDSTNPDLWASGATEPPGGRHAEIVALDRFQDRYSSAPDSLVVTLEPCSKTGRTPPCVDRIRSIPELQTIYIGGLDPGLSGEGVHLLEHGGRKVYLPATLGTFSGNESSDSDDLQSQHSHRRAAERRLPGLSSFLSGLRRLYGLFPASFAHRIQYGRPRLILKAASDASGIMGDKEQRVTISGAGALHTGQLLRRAADAVLVGPGTVLTDEPGLDWRPAAQVLPIGVTRNLLLSKEGSGNASPHSLSNSDTRGTSQSEKPPASAPVNSATAQDRQSEKLPISLPHYLRSADPFLEALLRYGDEKEMLTTEFDHQPRRVFLIPEGKMDPARLKAFQERQWERFQTGGPEPVFWTLSKKNKPGDLPSLKDPSFGSSLMQALAELGLNTVLVEGGAGLHGALQAILQPDDRFYWLRSKSSLQSQEFQKPVELPQYLTKLPELQLMDLGPDELIAFAGRA